MHSLDVRHLARHGYLDRDDEFTKVEYPSSTFEVHFDGAAVWLGYRQRGATTDVTQRIELAHQSCNFGGLRTWFICPSCLRQCALVYMGASRAACRKCQRLKYTSHADDELAAIHRKQLQLEARLGGANSWMRPKGMHERTHQRLRAELRRLKARADELLIAECGWVLDFCRARPLPVRVEAEQPARFFSVSTLGESE